MNIDQLITIIETAFDGVPQPTDMTLHAAQAWDSYGFCTEEDRKKDDTGRWQNLPKEHIEECQNALSYLNKVGMRFYLPAYVIWYLKTLGTSDYWSDHTLYTLNNHPNSPELAECMTEQFSLFTKDQLKACALFLKFCTIEPHSDTSFAREIYDGYWHQYE